MSGSPYAPPAADDGTRPKVIAAFRLYASAAAVLYLALALLAAELRPEHAVALAVGSLAFAALHAVAAAAPLAPWSWRLALATIALGVPSCLVVFAIPLALAWTKPIVRAAYRLPP